MSNIEPRSVISGSDTPVRAVGAIEAEVDGARILLSPKDFAYFGLEGAGAAVWDLIDGERTVDQIVSELCARYDADSSTIRSGSVEFLHATKAVGITEIRT